MASSRARSTTASLPSRNASLFTGAVAIATLAVGSHSISASYGGGRYLLDTAKGADLGSDGERIVIDFNFMYHPSCRYDPRWVCPLAPAENTIDVPINAGERLAPP